MTHESEKCLQTHQQDSLVTPAVPAADVKVDFVCPEPMMWKIFALRSTFTEKKELLIDRMRISHCFCS